MKAPRVPRFVSLVLTTESVMNVGAIVPIKFSKKFLHHCTLAYKPSEEDYEKIAYSLGEPAFIEVIDEVTSNKMGVQALTVKPCKLDGTPFHTLNKVPHITVSTENVPPNLSNDMLTSPDESVEVRSLKGLIPNLLAIYEEEF